MNFVVGLVEAVYLMLGFSASGGPTYNFLVLVLALDPFLCVLQNAVFDYENEHEDDDEYE